MNEQPSHQSRDSAVRWPSPGSLADVHGIAAPHPAVWPLERLLEDCRLRQLRRSGPGGQHRNKVSTAIQWSHLPSGITAEANECREQARNRAVALHRLRCRLAIQLRSLKVPDPHAGDSPIRARSVLSDDEWTGEQPSIRWQVDPLETEYRENWGKQRLRIAPTNPAFPGVLALVLDDLHLAGGQPSLVGRLWKASTTKVIALISHEFQALAVVNGWRQHHGRGPLRA